jgi:hypothetical protein
VLVDTLAVVDIVAAGIVADTAVAADLADMAAVEVADSFG